MFRDIGKDIGSTHPTSALSFGTVNYLFYLFFTYITYIFYLHILLLLLCIIYFYYLYIFRLTYALFILFSVTIWNENRHRKTVFFRTAVSDF